MDATRDTPRAVTEAVTRHGGNNPYGRPMWRVVLAHNHVSKKRGDWHIGIDGNATQFRLKPGTMIAEHDPLKVGKVEYDTIHETPVFPVPNGWILERWFPASVYGTRENWSPNQGPYPEEGDYWMMNQSDPETGRVTPWNTIPEIGDLEKAISMWEYEYLKRPTNFEAAYKIFAAEEKAEREAELIRQGVELQEFLKSEVYPVFNSTSLEAQRVRNQCQEAIGEKSHIGAGQ